jgi:hypothetical protein
MGNVLVARYAVLTGRLQKARNLRWSTMQIRIMKIHVFPPSGRIVGIVALKNYLALDCELAQRLGLPLSMIKAAIGSLPSGRPPARRLADCVYGAALHTSNGCIARTWQPPPPRDHLAGAACLAQVALENVTQFRGCGRCL